MRIRHNLPPYVIYGLALAPFLFGLYLFLLWLLKYRLGLLPLMVWSRSPQAPEIRVFIVAVGLTLTYFWSIWYHLHRMKGSLRLGSLISFVFLSVLCSMLVWSSLLGIIGSVLNKVLDGSDPMAYRTEILSSRTENTWPGGPFVLLTVRSWRTGGGAELIRIPGAVPLGAKKGDWITVKTKEGLFGIPWVVEVTAAGGH